MSLSGTEKFLPIYRGAPSSEVRFLHIKHLKFPLTSLGDPSSEIRLSQQKQAKSPPTYFGAPSNEVRLISSEQSKSPSITFGGSILFPVSKSNQTRCLFARQIIESSL